MLYCTRLICLRMLGVANEVRGNSLLFHGGILFRVLAGDGYLEMREVAAR